MKAKKILLKGQFLAIIMFSLSALENIPNVKTTTGDTKYFKF